MNEIDYKRQLDLFNPEEFRGHVTIIGLGNIGSNTAILLARLGIQELTLYDFDKVEGHNLTSQAFTVKDLGKSKVDAMEDYLSIINPDIMIRAMNEKFEGDDIPINSDILLIAVDTMKERKRIYGQLKANCIYPKLIIDARVGGEQLEVYSCTGLEDWFSTFTDNPAQDPCGGRFICYVSAMVSAVITNQVKKFIKGDEYDKSIMIHTGTLEVAKNFSW